MIDYERIGRRIAEQRKYIKRISQEKMAEDLMMYQADISNLEKAKKGSGITDLARLDMLAEYFGISLESLLFGTGDSGIVKYYGKKMELKQSQKKVKKEYRRIIAGLTGHDAEKIEIHSFECGPYAVHVMREYQMTYSGDLKGEPDFILLKLHIYIFLGTEVVCAAVTDVTSVFQHIYEPFLRSLQMLIPPDVLEVTDALRTLNPYWALYTYTDDAEAKEYLTPMFKRMDELKALEDMLILYVESVYVREDYRRNGLFRMCLDVLRTMYGDCIIWLNMEPTAGAELEYECGYFAHYTVSDLGQINMNASIAERLGFTVDPDTWKREAAVINADGEFDIQIIPVRKNAYYLPKKVREILKYDGDLIEVGRAKQRIKEKVLESQYVEELKDGEIEGYAVCEWKATAVSGPATGEVIHVYAAYQMYDHDIHKFGVSERSVFDCGLNYEELLEEYECLDDAFDSLYWDELYAVDEHVQKRLHIRQ